MSPAQILSLLLALSASLNLAATTIVFVRRNGAGTAAAIRTGATAAATGLGLYFAAVAAYH